MNEIRIGIAMLIMLCLGLYFGFEISLNSIKLRCIELNHAHYDSKTKDFTWDNESTKYIVLGEK